MARKFLIQPISPAAAGPLYQQIVESIKREIGEGRLDVNAPLPSFRALGKDLNVSLITVKRAYEELEHEGIIYRKQGLGTFVADDAPARSRALKRKHTEALLRNALREGLEAGLTPDDLRALVNEYLPDPKSKESKKKRSTFS
jgi:GntR family transcriptional regulator